METDVNTLQMLLHGATTSQVRYIARQEILELLLRIKYVALYR